MEKERPVKNNFIVKWFLKNKEYLFLILILSLFSFVCLYKMGSVSSTIDEHNDLWIANCYLNNPFQYCQGFGENQGKLPFYIHAIAEYLFRDLTGINTPNLISFLFGIGILVVLYFFIKKEFNLRLAQLSILLMSISIPLLASTRMILHHSNIIMTFFNILSIIVFYHFIKYNNLNNHKKSRIYLLLTIIFYFLAISSGFLNIFTLVLFILMYLMNLKKGRFHKKHGVILLSTIILSWFMYTRYLKLEQVYTALSQYLSYSSFPNYWSYLNTGSNLAPRWFSFFIFLIKITPWWTIFFIAFAFIVLKWKKEIRNNLQKNFLLSCFMYILFYLSIASGVFRYDTPPHQVIFYPLAYIIIAYSILYLYKAIKNLKIKWLLVFLISIFIIFQIFQIFQFFPNYLFYGSQYGKTYVGELYGPAVLHCQDTDTINQKISDLSKQNASFLFPNIVCGPIYKPGNSDLFNQRNITKHYDYAFWEYLYEEHLKDLKTSGYKDYLDNNCSLYYEYKFPTNFTAYAIYNCN